MKRMFLLLLASCLAISVLLAGCSKNGGEENPAADRAKTTGDSEKATDEGAKTESSEPVTLKILAQENYNAQISYTNLPILKELEKRANVKLEWELVPPNDIAGVAQTRLSAGVELPDIMELNMDSNKFFEAAQSGMFIPMTDLIEKFAPNIKKTISEEFPLAKKMWTMPDGNIYSITYTAQNIGVQYVSELIRYDWLQKVGITKLPETVDEYYTALKAMRDQDANGNNKKDEMYSGQGYQLSLTLPQAFGLNVQGWWTNWDADDNGKVFPTWTSDKAKALYQFLNKMFTEGLIDPEYATLEYDKSQARLKSNVVSAASFYAQAVKRNYNDIVGGGAEYRTLDPLKGPDGTSRAIVFNIPGGYNGYNWVITKNAKNPEAAIKFLDYVYSPEGRMLLQYGIEGVHYKMVDGKPVSIMDEFVAKNPDKYKTVQEAIDKEGLTPIGALPYVRIVSEAEAFKSGESNQVDIDSYDRGLKVLRMPYLSAMPTLDEQKVEAEVGGELWTYINEMRDKFIMGKESFDNWDKYVQKANDLGISKLLPIEQKKYERFQADK